LLWQLLKWPGLLPVGIDILTTVHITTKLCDWIFALLTLRDDGSLVQVVQKADYTIHQINHYPAATVVCFVNTYPLDSDLYSG